MLPDATTVESIISGADISGAEVSETSLGIVCTCVQSDAPALLEALKASELRFAMLVDMLGTDTGEDLEITYHLRSFARDEEIFVKSTVPYGAEIVSVWNAFPSSLMPERETAELYGLTLAGHPNPKRLLTTDGIDPLLLKAVAIRTVEEVRDR